MKVSTAHITSNYWYKKNLKEIKKRQRILKFKARKNKKRQRNNRY